MDNSRAYTLIELLVVIAIIGILSLVGFVNFKSFSADQVAVKAAGQIQSYLRLAQTNATTSTKCNNQAPANWSLTFSGSSPVSVELWCSSNDPVTPPVTHYTQRIYTLDTNAQISLGTCPATITYLIGSGMLPSTASDCSITVQNSSVPASVKTISVTVGGAISVQ